jgi:hypothetical protein
VTVTSTPYVPSAVLAGTVVEKGIVKLSDALVPQVLGTFGIVPGLTLIPEPLGGAKLTSSASPGVKW